MPSVKHECSASIRRRRRFNLGLRVVIAGYMFRPPPHRSADFDRSRNPLSEPIAILIDPITLPIDAITRSESRGRAIPRPREPHLWPTRSSRRPSTRSCRSLTPSQRWFLTYPFQKFTGGPAKFSSKLSCRYYPPKRTIGSPSHHHQRATEVLDVTSVTIHLPHRHRGSRGTLDKKSNTRYPCNSAKITRHARGGRTRRRFFCFIECPTAANRFDSMSGIDSSTHARRPAAAKQSRLLVLSKQRCPPPCPDFATAPAPPEPRNRGRERHLTLPRTVAGSENWSHPRGFNRFRIFIADRMSHDESEPRSCSWLEFTTTPN